MIRRGTTPTLTFTLSEAVAIAALYITFSQTTKPASIYDKGVGTVMLEKSLSDVTITDNVITLPLSQADTLALDAGPVLVQARIKDTEGNAIATETINDTVADVLKDGEI